MATDSFERSTATCHDDYDAAIDAKSVNGWCGSGITAKKASFRFTKWNLRYANGAAPGP